MAQLKDALGDFINDNYNRGTQGAFLRQSEQALGIKVPLKEDQIRVANREKVLVKRKAEK